MTLEALNTAFFLKNSIKHVELLTALVSTFYYYKYKNTNLSFILYLLWFTVIIEFTSYFLGLLNILKSSFWLYNYIYHPINFMTLLILYLIFVKKKKYVMAIRIFIVSFIVVYFFNMIIGNYKTDLITLPFIIGGAFIIISISFYLLELLNSNKVLFVWKNLLFWLSVGLLIYFAGKIPMRLARNYWEEIAHYNALSITGSLLSIFMNFCFIIGFIWSERRFLY